MMFVNKTSRVCVFIVCTFLYVGAMVVQNDVFAQNNVDVRFHTTEELEEILAERLEFDKRQAKRTGKRDQIRHIGGGLVLPIIEGSAFKGYKSVSRYDVKDFSFSNLSCFGIEREDMEEEYLKNMTFAGAVLKGAFFKGVHFVDCSFKNADMRDVNTLAGVFRDKPVWYGSWYGSFSTFKNCDFTGAEIGGAKFGSITRKQLLSTSNFTQYKDRKRINLENCVFLRQRPYEDYMSDDEFDMSDIDFNKFNNGEKTAAPLNARSVTFGFGDRDFPNTKVPQKYLMMCKCNFSGANLQKSTFSQCNLKGSNFAKANLIGAFFAGSNVNECNFEDAEIQGARFIEYSRGAIINGLPITPPSVEWNHYHYYFCNDRCKKNINDAVKLGLTADQLKCTADFKRKELLSIALGYMDLSNVDLSGFNLTGCKFMGNLRNTNFTNAVITGCSFGGCDLPKCTFTLETNLTVDQIKSTWNYKNNNMNGIKLPIKIQETLDAEKKANPNNG